MAKLELVALTRLTLKLNPDLVSLLDSGVGVNEKVIYNAKVCIHEPLFEISVPSRVEVYRAIGVGGIKVFFTTGIEDSSLAYATGIDGEDISRAAKARRPIDLLSLGWYNPIESAKILEGLQEDRSSYEILRRVFCSNGPHPFRE